MTLPIYQVDAFTSRLFGGNPAAICPLTEWLPDSLMQNIAAENNLAETAYFVPEGDGFRLRWFTPATEVDLCGHATVAAAAVLMEILEPGRTHVDFESRSGLLKVDREGNTYWLDFPSRPPTPTPESKVAVETALGAPMMELLAARDYLAVFESEERVRTLRPDMKAVAKLDKFAVIATAPGNDCDFVSRFFAPAQGIDEDPVTGSAHCTLTPYWAERLGKQMLSARQVSTRGGELKCERRGDRVRIGGGAVHYLTGEIYLK